MQAFDVPAVPPGEAANTDGRRLPLSARPAPEPMRLREPAVRMQSAGTDLHESAATSLPPLATIALSRIGFGPRPGDFEAYEKLGATDSARFEAYVEQQLNPESLDDSEVDARVAAGNFTTLNKTFDQLWVDHLKGPPGGPTPSESLQILPFNETELQTFIQAIYSRRQLVAVLADFWHNHFNVPGPYAWAAQVWVSYDRDVIRANLLGNFRAFLEAVGTSLPMMMYLNGYDNKVAGPNENYARELFELHGLGAENYLGIRRQDEVPRDASNRPVGYVDDDVYESTRAFTGWGIDLNSGRFQYYSERHDRFQKTVLGKILRSDQGALKDGRDVYDLLASHPGTAGFVCRKLCRRFIADDPPQRIVAEAAAVFLAKKDAPDQIKQVVRTILLSPEFRTTWGQKVKRPYEFVVSCMRAVDANLDFRLDSQPSQYFISLFAQAGQPLFRWLTPDGYPDTREKWIGSNAFVGRWRLANWLNEVKNWWDKSYKPFDPFAQMPAEVRTATAIVDFWTDRILGRPMSAAARQNVIEFMARGRDPEMPYQGFQDEQLRERVWGTIAPIMIAPDNLLR